MAVAYVSYEFFEKRFLRLKRLFGRAEKQAPQSPRGLNAAEPYGPPQALPIGEEESNQRLPQPVVFEAKRPGLAGTGDGQSTALASTVEKAGRQNFAAPHRTTA